MKTIKISELPLYNSLKGLYTIGTDSSNRSVKVSLEFIDESVKSINEAITAVGKAIKQTESATKSANDAAKNADSAVSNMKVEYAGELKKFTEQVASKQDTLNSSTDIKVNGNELSITEVAKRQVFDDLWDSATGDYGGKEPGHMEGNELKEYHCNEVWLTYEEARAVYNAGPMTGSALNGKFKNNTAIKTILPDLCEASAGNWTVDQNLDGAFAYCSKIERLRFCSSETNSVFTISSFIYAFLGCSSLSHIYGVLNITNVKIWWEDFFTSCKKLVLIKLKGLKINAFLGKSPLLSADSVRYMVQNAANTSTITFTYHADVYAKIIANEGEWAGILDLAQSKNISIASA